MASRTQVAFAPRLATRRPPSSNVVISSRTFYTFIHHFVHLTTVAISLLGLVVSPFSSSCNYLILSLAHLRPKSVAATQLLSNGHRTFRVFLSVPRQHRRAACPAFNTRATSQSTPLLLNVDFLINLNKASSLGIFRTWAAFYCYSLGQTNSVVERLGRICMENQMWMLYRRLSGCLM